MIKLSGTLFIRSIQGRHGAFSVGRLVTEIGDFAIKDAVLDQYEEGRYEGEFGISKIYPSSYFAQSRMVVEVRATLETLALAIIDELPADQQAAGLPEPDPLDTEPPLPTGAPCPTAAPAPAPAEPMPHSREAEAASEDARLFGMLWPLGQSVKLDTTVDRALFRRQKDRLKAMGYRFQPVGQVWHLQV
jgi:hypothetical protein